VFKSTKKHLNAELFLVQHMCHKVEKSKKFLPAESPVKIENDLQQRKAKVRLLPP
jgi:hypothetical protein